MVLQPPGTQYRSSWPSDEARGSNPWCCSAPAGLATYMNVAITDPLQQRGLLAFDDTELAQAGATAAAVLSTGREPAGSANLSRLGPRQQLAEAESSPVVSGDADMLAALEEGLLYVVAVSRNCSGNLPVVSHPSLHAPCAQHTFGRAVCPHIDRWRCITAWQAVVTDFDRHPRVCVCCTAGASFSCQEIPTEGPAGVPITRPLLTISRVYINPVTGVGPEPASLVPFNTLQLTPKVVVRGARKAAAPEAAGARLVPGTAGRASSSNDSSNSSKSDNSSVRISDERSLAVTTDTDLAAAVAETAQQTGSSQLPAAQRPLLLRTTIAPQSIWRAGKPPSEFLDLAAGYTPPVCPASGPDQNLTSSSTVGPGMQNEGSIDDPCVRSFVGMSQCTPKGSADVCCGFVQSWSASNCWCRGSGQQLLDSMPLSVTPVLLQLLGWVCE